MNTRSKMPAWSSASASGSRLSRLHQVDLVEREDGAPLGRASSPSMMRARVGVDARARHRPAPRR